MTRDEHLEWCKTRAREYLERNQPLEAWASFLSDMQKHPETTDHVALEIGMSLLMIGDLQSVPDMRRFIEGFH